MSHFHIRILRIFAFQNILKKWEKRVQVTEIIIDIGQNDSKLIVKISIYFKKGMNSIMNIQSLQNMNLLLDY